MIFLVDELRLPPVPTSNARRDDNRSKRSAARRYKTTKLKTENKESEICDVRSEATTDIVEFRHFDRARPARSTVEKLAKISIK